MEIFKEINGEYIIKFNNRNEAEAICSFLEFTTREKTRQQLGDRVLEEEYNLAKNISDELRAYLEFNRYY